MGKKTFTLVSELFSKWVQGWVWDFRGYENEESWNDSFELTYKTRQRILVIPFPAHDTFDTKEDAMAQSIARARDWVSQNGLQKILDLGKEVEIRLSLRDYPEAYTWVPFSEGDINLGDPVQFVCTGEKGTICDAVFDGQESGHYKITYEVDRGDGLYFRTDAVGLRKLVGER